MSGHLYPRQRNLLVWTVTVFTAPVRWLLGALAFAALMVFDID